MKLKIFFILLIIFCFNSLSYNIDKNKCQQIYSNIDEAIFRAQKKDKIGSFIPHLEFSIRSYKHRDSYLNKYKQTFEELNNFAFFIIFKWDFIEDILKKTHTIEAQKLWQMLPIDCTYGNKSI